MSKEPRPATIDVHLQMSAAARLGPQCLNFHEDCAHGKPVALLCVLHAQPWHWIYHVQLAVVWALHPHLGHRPCSLFSSSGGGAGRWWQLQHGSHVCHSTAST